MDKRIAAIGSVLVFTLAIVACGTLLAVRGAQAPTLVAALSRIKSLTRTTIAHARLDLDVEVNRETSVDPSLAGELRNNYSLVDRGNPDRYPNYNDCDGWEHLLRDGWSADYEVWIELRSREDARALLRSTREFWRAKGYPVRETTPRVPSDVMARYSPGEEISSRPIMLPRGVVVDRLIPVNELVIDLGEHEGIQRYGLRVDVTNKIARLGGGTYCLQSVVDLR